MTPNPAPGAAPGPQQKKMSGCVIALLVAGSVLALLCLTGGVTVWRASQSETGKRIFSVVGKGIEMAEKGVNAPGAQQLREAGCPQALVIDTREMVAIVGELIDGGPPSDTSFTGAMALCQGNLFDELPECDTLAEVYRRAVAPTAEFSVTVKVQGNSKAKCTVVYQPDGRRKLVAE